MNLLIDLDGTITDPESGILGSVRFALDRLGIAAPEPSRHWVIGPPLRQSFPQLGVPADRVEEAIGYYRERYAGGAMFDCALYDGIEQALRTLKASGHRLFVATSKPHAFARPLLAHFGLSDVFDAIHGAELDGRNDAKKDVIASILSAHRLPAGDCVMVGDTAFDVEGARHHGIPTIGVAWGHGGERLGEARPAVLIGRPGELVDAVAALAAAR